MNNLSNFVKQEVDQLQKITFPLLKKTSRYMVWALPLLGVSFVNLILLLFFTPMSTGTMVMSGVYALLGAIGMALLKETKINNKQIQKIGSDYMIERINKSRFVSEGRKREYISSIRKQPVKALNKFVQFLSEEEKIINR